MHNSSRKAQRQASPLAGHNQSYVEELYQTYLTDPNQLSDDWRELFKQLLTEPTKVRDAGQLVTQALIPHNGSSVCWADSTLQHQVQILINAFRTHGHRQAALDPLQLRPLAPVSALQLAWQPLAELDATTSIDTSTLPIYRQTLTLAELYAWLQQTYCGSIGAEFMHLDPPEQQWIQQRLESIERQHSPNSTTQQWLLEQLTAADGLERYLAAKFPGAKRFSLEGGDALIPLLNQMVQHASAQGVQQIVLGMAHRGRLNVLVNVLGKAPCEICAAFAGQQDLPVGSGDVKYHQGYAAVRDTPSGPVEVALLFNPSHLEIVNPVVMGAVRARQDQFADLAGRECVLPITLHGDSAMMGQGVVQETFNLSQVPGYSVGGTVRVVINNQIGFTTPDHLARSTRYCTDVAKIITAPVLHVNGDDPEAVLFVAQLALDFRRTFKRDVVIDLVCYRRHGHNEADEPHATQPLMYQRIKQHPTPCSRYATQLITTHTITPSEATALVERYRAALDQGTRLVAAQSISNSTMPEGNDAGVSQNIAREDLQALGRQMCHHPSDFVLHNRVEKIYRDRQKMVADEQPFDWGGAEALAYATLLAQGMDVRLSGQDSGRGTFFHRHVVLHHQQTGGHYIPLTYLQPQQGRFSVWDSVLSEAAVLAFEYGYALSAPHGLVIWEAQFGDFANGAQVVIDQFISAGEQKWDQRSGVTLLLPHGYEGQGPEHSSARLERYLQLCAEQNLQVCVPSTPAQIYHLLRRQALQSNNRPLVVMSPKSLLRHPLATSSLDDLALGGFQCVLNEVDPVEPDQVKQIVLCSGKVYYDLLAQRRKNQQHEIVLIRIEQLYPFPHALLQAMLAEYQQVEEVIWCQEEPMNQGAWLCIHPWLRATLPAALELRYVGRPAAASPAVGHLALHQQQQHLLVDQALTRNTSTGDTLSSIPLLKKKGNAHHC